MSEQRAPLRTNDRRVMSFLMIGLLALFGSGYVAAYYAISDRVPRGTKVSGVEIGGLTPASAEATLERELAERAGKRIVITALDKRGRIKPEEVGLGVDAAASVEQAGGGRSWAPADMWDSLTRGESMDAVLTVDETALEETLAGFSAEVDAPAREGAVRFKGTKVVTRAPAPGTVVDQDAAFDAVLDAYLDAEGPVELPTTVDEPEITATDVSAATEDFANPAVSGPVFLDLGAERVRLRPRDFAPALKMVAQDGELVPELNGKKLLRRIEPRMKTVALEAKDAKVALVNGRPKVIPAKKGVTFDPDEVVEGFLDVVVEKGKSRTMRVSAVVDRPEFTTKDARALGVVEEVSEFTTFYPHADYRNVNLGRAAELVNGTLLLPGEEFSLNETVGERTAENGFVEGFIISNGVFKEDFGGGVSQVATTLFNAMFFAGLKDIEHKPHSFYIDRYPVGREATVAWPYVDLRFQNDTEYGVLIQAFVDPSTPGTSGAMTVRMWSTKVWDIRSSQSGRYDLTQPETRRLEGDDCVPNEGYGGFEIDVFRSFYKVGSNELDHRERFHTTYTPSDKVICES